MNQAGIWSGPRDMVTCLQSLQSEESMGLGWEKMGCGRVASFKGVRDTSLLENISKLSC